MEGVHFCHFCQLRLWHFRFTWSGIMSRTTMSPSSFLSSSSSHPHPHPHPDPHPHPKNLLMLVLIRTSHSAAHGAWSYPLQTHHMVSLSDHLGFYDRPQCWSIENPTRPCIIWLVSFWNLDKIIISSMLIVGDKEQQRGIKKSISRDH